MTKIHPKPQLIACDYDGTLANGLGKITERTKAALNLAHEQGCILALVTGRSASMIPAEVNSLPFDFIITANGARIKDMSTGFYLAVATLKKETTLKILDILERHFPLSTNIYLNGQSVYNTGSLKTLKASAQGSCIQMLAGMFYFLNQARFSRNLRKLAERTFEPIEKIGCYFKTKEACQKTLQAVRICEVEALTTHGNDLEITAKGVTKGWALVTLCNMLGIPKEAVIAFGDSGNDLSMVNVAGCFLAPANATPDVLAAATYVIPSVAENGVATALEELYGWE